MLKYYSNHSVMSCSSSHAVRIHAEKVVNSCNYSHQKGDMRDFFFLSHFLCKEILILTDSLFSHWVGTLLCRSVWHQGVMTGYVNETAGFVPIYSFY